jgi:hypothetical protein
MNKIISDLGEKVDFYDKVWEKPGEEIVTLTEEVVQKRKED